MMISSSKFPVSTKSDFPAPSLITKSSTIVQNPILASTNVLASKNIQQPSLARVQTPTQYLTVSSEGTSTFTELDGDDLVDVDYVSECSLDLSNDEDEEENFEDIQTEIYLRNLFYSIDRLTFDDLTSDESPSTSFSLIELPKNLIAECHVWRQKFRLKKSSLVRTQRPQRVNVSNTRVRSRRTSTEQAIINKVIDWSVENSLSSFPKLSSLQAKELTDTKDHNSLDRPLVKVPKSNGGWMQPLPLKLNQPQAQPISNRITLPPIVNPKRPQSNEQLTATSHATTAVILRKHNLEFKPKEESRQSFQTKQPKQTYPLQTSQSFNEQSENNDKNIASNRASASSSYSRITLNDLLDQRGDTGSARSHHRSPVHLPSSHLLKLPVIES